MINRYITENGRLETTENHLHGSWISVIAPTNEELADLAEELSLDEDILRAALDTEERSRLEVDEAFTMFLVNIPYISVQADRELYDPMPLSIILTKDTAVTVCLQDSPVLRQFATGKVLMPIFHVSSVSQSSITLPKCKKMASDTGRKY